MPHLHHEKCVSHPLCEANHRTVVGEGAADVTSRIWRKRQKPQGSEKDITGGDEQEVNVVSYKIVNVGFVTHLATFFCRLKFMKNHYFKIKIAEVDELKIVCDNPFKGGQVKVSVVVPK